MAKKPAPALQSSFKERDQFQLGSLSHVLNQRCTRYIDLPEFPQVSSDPILRREPNSSEELKIEDEENEEFDESDESSDEESQEESDEEISADDEDDEESDEDENDDDEESNEDSDEGSVTSSRDKTDEIVALNGHSIKKENEPISKVVDLLLDLDFSAAGGRQIIDGVPALPSRNRSLLNIVEGGGIELSVSFPRYNDAQYTPLQFVIRNASETNMENISLKPPAEMDVKGELSIHFLPHGDFRTFIVGADFGDSAKRSEWKLIRAGDDICRNFTIEVPLGEQVQPIRITLEEVEVERRRLGGLNRHRASLTRPLAEQSMLSTINAYKMENGWYTCQTRSRKDLVLIQLMDNAIEVSSDNAVVGKMIVTLIQSIAMGK